MKKRIIAYLNYIDGILMEDDSKRDWEQERKDHLVQIGFFAHERQVHLIVMVLFALCTLATMLYFCFTSEMMVLALCGAFFVLLVPYIMHYYLLENSVQRMYSQYDDMMAKLRESFHM